MANISLFGTSVGLDIHGASHTTDLAAHTKNLFEIQRTGEYMSTLGCGDLTRPLLANSLVAIPFVVVRNKTFDRIAIHVSTAAAAGILARLGIYNIGTNGYPGTLVLDAGTVLVDTTGVKAITISQALTKGIYFLACVSDGTPTCYAPNYRLSLGWLLGLSSTDFASMNIAWRVAFTFAALPNPFTAGGSFNVANYPGIALRLLTLD